MIKVGITGGIGSGKTTVAKLFERLGIPVFYSDDAAKNLMNFNVEVRQAIIENFGAECYGPECLNRQHLASIVFNDKAKLDKLNQIVHEGVGKLFSLWMAEHADAPYVLKEAALIFEANVKLDYVIGVSAPYEVRLQRAMDRDNSTKEAIEQRINSQMSQEDKMKLCNFVILNNGEDLMPQILNIDKQLRTL